MLLALTAVTQDTRLAWSFTSKKIRGWIYAIVKALPSLARSLTIVVLVVALLIPLRANMAQQPDLAAAAIAAAATSSGLPTEQLELVNSVWLAKQVYRAKVLDRKSGNISVVSLHPSGLLATEEEVNSLIEKERGKGFTGKLQESVRQRVQADADGASPIMIWVATPDVPRERWRTDLENGRSQQVFREAADFHKRAEVPVLQFLTAHSITPKAASELAPMITADVPNALLSELERLPTVSRIYADGIPKPTLNISIPVIRAEQVVAGRIYRSRGQSSHC